MQRRALLASVGAGAIVGVSGCLVESGTSDDPEDGDTPTDRTDTTSTDIADQPCPPYEIDRARTVCSHTVDTDSAAVYLEADRDRSTIANGIPVERIPLTLHNRSSEELAFDPHSWRIRYNDGSGWEEIQPAVRRDGDRSLQPGGEESWTFLLAVESVQEGPELDPGLYAAEIDVPDPESPDDRIACIALVRLDAAE